MQETRVSLDRWQRWTENFARSHGSTTYAVDGGSLCGEADDTSWFRARLPFGREYDGAPDPAALAAQGEPPGDWGVLLVRKGGFAVARLSGRRMTVHKVGQRHVQGRTKAGGQSQQRFARRRENQARVAYAAAAEHALRILSGLSGPLVTGGDAGAVEQVLADPRLAGVARRRLVDLHRGDVHELRRSELDQVVAEAQTLRVQVHNA